MSNLELDFQNPEGFIDIPDETTIASWVDAAAKQEDSYSVSVRIVAEQEARTLNKDYRHKDYATNVLSFPFDPPPIPMESTHLGDLVICKQVVEKEAKEQRKSVNDHWAHLIIHGTLHLQGYDHITEPQASEMESLEITLLQKLGIKNPYQER